MSDEHIDDMLRELQGDLMAVRPSPEFAAKVRQQVATQPARSWFGIWQVATASGVLAIVALAIVLWRVEKTNVDVPAPAMVVAQNPPTTPAPVASSQSVAPTTTVETHRTTTKRVNVAPRTQVQRVASRELEVIVPEGDVLAFHRFMGHVKSGMSIELASQSPSIDETTGELAPLPALTIPPLVVEPLPGGADGRSSGSEKR